MFGAARDRWPCGGAIGSRLEALGRCSGPVVTAWPAASLGLATGERVNGTVPVMTRPKARSAPIHLLHSSTTGILCQEA